MSAGRWLLKVITMISILITPSKGRENCQTLEHKQCQFPFEYNNKMYTGCTDINHPGKFWCRTRTNSSNIVSSEDWDYCTAYCPVNGGGTIGSIGCKTGDICMAKDSCPVYTNYVANHRSWTRKKKEAEKKKLRGKICKKKPDRLCCKAEKIRQASINSCSGEEQSFQKSFLPKKDQCGLSCSGSKSVVFGSNAVLGEFPWAALVGSEKVLRDFDDRNKYWGTNSFTLYHCGGTLINTWFVLTAAHCHKSDAKIVQVVLGEWNVLTDPDCTDEKKCDNPKIQKRGVSDVIIHSGYDRSKITNDIALIKMNKEVMLNRFVQLSCLPLPEYKLPTYFHNPELQQATVIGWGETNKKSSDYEENIKRQHGVLTTKLQKGRVPIQPVSMCSETYKQYKMTTSQLCAGGDPSTYTDSCRGDSGGGLFVDSGDFKGQSDGNVHVLVGVVSYGARLCGDSPSVYTKVDQFIPWIRKTIG